MTNPADTNQASEDDDVNSYINQESEEDLLITLQEIGNNKLRQQLRQKIEEL